MVLIIFHITYVSASPKTKKTLGNNKDTRTASIIKGEYLFKVNNKETRTKAMDDILLCFSSIKQTWMVLYIINVWLLASSIFYEFNQQKGQSIL